MNYNFCYNLSFCNHKQGHNNIFYEISASLDKNDKVDFIPPNDPMIINNDTVHREIIGIVRDKFNQEVQVH